MSPTDRAWAEIDLNALRQNLLICKNIARDANLWPVLKANAYGHGAIECARVCQELNVALIGVGDSKEALQLRQAGIHTRLLILGTAIDSEIEAVLDHNIEVGIHSELRIQELGAIAKQHGKRLPVHLKIDTGMGRLGIRPEAIGRISLALSDNPFLELKGVMSHFSSGTGNFDEVTEQQNMLFLAAVDELRHLLPNTNFTTHIANSAALFTGVNPLGDAVRPGIAMFGILPAKLSQQKLQPVLSLRTQIAFFKDVPANTPVGYDSTWVAHAASRIATIPIGYNDGVPYRLGLNGNSQVLVRGQRCPIVGRVSMDYCTIDVTHVVNANVGDIVTIIGSDGDEFITAADIAEQAGTIAYEVCCSIGSRVSRRYIGTEINSDSPAHV
ncbi:MAG: alanine racemase [Planctomycetes bacterium]|nr:alanine racemase [Planctomycetota bacterium]